jgi:peptide/nickel transport system substrate-binding protein
MWQGTSAYTAPILRNVAEALVSRDAKTNALVGELATKWDQTNPTTWRFTLRPNVKFHDGTPFNAEAAAFSLNHTWTKENNFKIRQYVGPEMTFKSIDETTLDVTTETPDPILPSRLYFSPIGSPKLMKETPDLYPVKPVGTGPYKLVEWNKGQNVKLTANPDWWGNGSPDARGAATIKDVTVVFRADGTVRAGMIKTGEGDVARGLTNDQCKASPVCATTPTVETVFLRLDTSNPAMGDVRVRQAIALSVDKSSIMNVILGGGDLSAQMVGPSALGFNKDTPPYPFDPAKAKQLLTEAKAAGVQIDVPLTVYIRRGFFVGVEEAGEAIGEMLKQGGFPNIQTKTLETGQYQALINVPQKPIPADRGMIALHSHSNEIMDFSTSVGGYFTCAAVNSTVCDPALDEMHKAALPLAGAERDKAFQAIQKYVYDRFYTIPIGHPNFYFGLSQRVEWAPRLDSFLLVKEMKLKG